MSRILRRPMFRGGRVDARGTGITSNLGYQSGGAVQPQAYYGVGNNMNRDASGREKHAEFVPTDPQAIIDARRLGILMTPKHLDERFRKEYHLDDEVNYEGSGIPITGMQGMIETEAGVDLEGNPIIEEGGIFDITRNQILEDERAKDFYKKKFIEDNYATEIEKQKKALEAVGDLESLAKLTDGSAVKEKGELTLAEQRTLLDQEYADKMEAFLKDQMKQGTPEEEIEKNKKIFQKAYGSGVADDASAMLMGVAGKMLKPGATVKSGFGEFFEDEQKRPSERKKYKDAATTAAINAYLTGEKSIADFEKALKLNRAKLEDQVSIGAAASNLEGKEWSQVLDIVQKDRYRGTKKRDSFTVVSEALKGKFGKNVDQKKGDLKDIDAEDLIEGFTILTTPSGKIILEKIDGEIINRTDLII